MKICPKCKSKKELSEFAKDKSKLSGYNYKCKKCDREDKVNKNKTRQKIKSMKYPLGITNTDLYTIGNRFYLDNKPYTGYYHIINGEFFTEKLPGKYSKKLIQYQKEFIYKDGFDPNKKYFVKKINEGYARSVGVNEYQNYINNPLYKTVEINSNNIDEINNAIKLIPEIQSYL